MLNVVCEKGIDMKLVAVLCCCFLASGIARADESLLSQVADGLAKQTEEMSIVPLIAQDGRTVTLSYRTRKFMVHNTDKLGRHSEKAHETVAPKTDGLIARITIQDGRYSGAAKIPQTLKRPYWSTYVNAYPVAKGKQHLHVNISYGSKTDRETIKKIQAMLDSMIDDAPDKAKPKPGAHNKVLEGTSQ
jgi:hypothetical protein